MEHIISRAKDIEKRLDDYLTKYNEMFDAYEMLEESEELNEKFWKNWNKLVWSGQKESLIEDVCVFPMEVDTLARDVLFYCCKEKFDIDFTSPQLRGVAMSDVLTEKQLDILLESKELAISDRVIEKYNEAIRLSMKVPSPIQKYLDKMKELKKVQKKKKKKKRK